jgi:hypothetical protein
VAGTFGFAGSNTSMIFLVMMAMVWLALAIMGMVRAWLLWLLVPALVIPMALGSAATFVILLPASIVGLLAWGARTHRVRIGLRTVVTGALFFWVVMWAAQAFALAPGFVGKRQDSATALFSLGYLKHYIHQTEVSGSTSRLGFLRLAVSTNLEDGRSGVLLGQGPTKAVVGNTRIQAGQTRASILTSASVHGFQRLLLAFGFVAAPLFAVMIAMPATGISRRMPRDDVAAALALALPIVAAIFVFAGPYNSSWSDPGVSAAYWSLVVVAHAGLHRERSGVRGGRDRSTEEGSAA